jgi:hypothetical protein
MLRRGMHLCPRLPSCVAQQSGPYSIIENHAPSDAYRISHKNHESLQKKECWENETGIKFVTIRKSTTQWWFLIVTELLSCTNRASKISLNSAVQMSNKNSHSQPFILHFRKKTSTKFYLLFTTTFSERYGRFIVDSSQRRALDWKLIHTHKVLLNLQQLLKDRSVHQRTTTNEITKKTGSWK